MNGIKQCYLYRVIGSFFKHDLKSQIICREYPITEGQNYKLDPMAKETQQVNRRLKRHKKKEL